MVQLRHNMTDVEFVSACNEIINAFNGAPQESNPDKSQALQLLDMHAANDFQKGCVAAIYHKWFTGVKTLYSIFD